MTKDTPFLNRLADALGIAPPAPRVKGEEDAFAMIDREFGTMPPPGVPEGALLIPARAFEEAGLDPQKGIIGGLFPFGRIRAGDMDAENNMTVFEPDAPLPPAVEASIFTRIAEGRTQGRHCMEKLERLFVDQDIFYAQKPLTPRQSEPLSDFIVDEALGWSDQGPLYTTTEQKKPAWWASR